VSENEYEIVEDNTAKALEMPTAAAAGGGGVLRTMRESLLRELRKDLSKLTNKLNENGAPSSAKAAGKADGPASAVGGAAAGAAVPENPKFVNVRPGLALGVITLQAGSRGPKISLH
jgi:hypothetical protein